MSTGVIDGDTCDVRRAKACLAEDRTSGESWADVRTEELGQSADIVLLGCGNVGSAVTRLLETSALHGPHVRISAALVRDTARPRDIAGAVPLTLDGRAALEAHPAAVVELLGGVEPARTLVLEALARRIPVVTANKTLLARHGSELRAAAGASGTPLLYEAAVLAGVPFLGTFARRPLAGTVTGLSGIANGTSNYILSRCAHEGCTFEQALAEAQRRGYAEPDPRNDVAGIDAAEKLGLLLQHFAGLLVDPDDLETAGIDGITPIHIAHARELGGLIKPLIHADWSDGVDAFVGPAFIDLEHVLARIQDEDNALLLSTPRGRLLFQGPGAGPDVTAATVLDDVHEVLAGTAATPLHDTLRPAHPTARRNGWLLTIEGRRVPRGPDLADFLGSHGIYVRRSTAHHTGTPDHRSLLTWPATRGAIDRALADLSAASGCRTTALRAYGDAE